MQDPSPEDARAATMPALFSPLTLRDVTSKNRIMVSPMCQYRSDDGAPNDWHLVHLGQFAIGGAGIVFHEETAVSAEGRKTYHCAGLYDESQACAYKRINAFLHHQGAVAALQLGHSGRKASNAGALRDWRPLDASDAATGHPPWQGVSASNVPHEDGWPAPRAMTHSEIRDNIDAWVNATRLAASADFDVLEIHGAHGYLIHQFLSPLSNRRVDIYGGSRGNRMRFALEVTEAVRNAWPAGRPLFFRVSCVDGKGGVWNMDDTIALAHELKRLNVDVVDCSSGGVSGETGMSLVPRVPGYHVEFAQRVRAETGLATIAVGLVTEAEHAEAILARGQADIVAMARELMLHPSWPVLAARALAVPDAWSVHPEDYAHRLRRREEIAKLTLQAAEQPLDPRLRRLIETT